MLIDPHRHKRVDARLRAALETGKLPRELLLCGPAGTGKTWGALTVLHTLAADYRDMRILIARQTRVALSESVCVTYEQEVLPADGLESIAEGASRGHRTVYRYPSGSEIVLGGLDKSSKITSTSWDLIFVNEAIEVQEDGWETLGSRLSRPGRDTRFGYLIADTNPGDPSHWLKKRLETGQTAGWDTSHRANPSLWDKAGNGWTPAGVAYLARLGRTTGTRRKRFLEGVWAAGEGVWFETFGADHVSSHAEYDPRYPVHLAIDSGVETAAVWFQVRPSPDGHLVTVFGDLYLNRISAFEVAKAILAKGWELGTAGRFDRGTTDPAGNSATGIGVTVLAEYARAGLSRLESWPSYPGSVNDGLRLMDSFVSVDPPGLLVHPRCVRLIEAFGAYRRAKRGGQWIDRPEDPQHPYEDVMDALRGGLQDKFPEGRRPEPMFRRVAARQVF